MIVFGLLTFGIYDIVVLSRIPEETNMVASRYDGKRTMQLWWALCLSVVTFGIYGLVWEHNLCQRIGNEIKRRQLWCEFGPADYWIWGVLGSIVGSIVSTILMMIVPLAGVTTVVDAALIIGVQSVLSMVSLVGPCIFIHKLLNAVNMMNSSYNLQG